MTLKLSEPKVTMIGTMVMPSFFAASGGMSEALSVMIATVDFTMAIPLPARVRADRPTSPRFYRRRSAVRAVLPRCARQENFVLNSAQDEQECARNHKESEGGVDQAIDPIRGRQVTRNLHANDLAKA